MVARSLYEGTMIESRNGADSLEESVIHAVSHSETTREVFKAVSFELALAMETIAEFGPVVKSCDSVDLVLGCIREICTLSLGNICD